MPIPSYILPSAPAYTEDSVYALIPTPSTPIYTPDAISFTRGSDATRTASNGLIQRVPWNLFQYSEDLSNASNWFTISATVTTNTTTAPNGTLTADKLTATATTSTHILLQQPAGSVSGATSTVSIYAKSAGLSNIQFLNNAGGLGVANFNLSAGTAVLVNGVSASIENVGNGWYRCIMTYTPTTSGNYNVQIRLADSSGNTTFLGNGTDGVFLWGAQLVEGSQPLPYFPTTDRLNVPRIDFSQGSCPALLLEPQRTNLVLNSNDMTLWSNGAGTMTKNVTTSPDGTNNALSFDNTGQCSTFVNAVNGTYSYSLFVKNGTSLAASIDMSDGATGDVLTTFTFSTKTFSGTSAGGSWTSASTSFVELNNGWFRITLTATKNAGSQIGYKINSTGVGGTSTYVYGAQLELGSYATTYIPTTTTSVTRLADTATRTGISSLIGQSEGTIFIQFSGKPSNGNSRALTITGGGQEFLIFYEQTATGNLGIVGTNTGLVYIDTGGANDKMYKIAYAYSSNNYALYVNGVSKTITQSPNVYSTLSRIDLNQKENGTEIGLTRIHQVALFQTRLTNTQLASLTTL